MRSSLSAWLLLSALGLGCASGASAPPPSPRGDRGAIKHSVRPVTVGEGLEENPLPGLFEQAFCNALFEMNDKQVVCADDVRALLRIEAERSTLGGDTMPIEEIEKNLDTPRQVSLHVLSQGAQLRVTATVFDRSKATLAKFETTLKADSSNLTDQARSLGVKVLSLP